MTTINVAGEVQKRSLLQTSSEQASKRIFDQSGRGMLLNAGTKRIFLNRSNDAVVSRQTRAEPRTRSLENIRMMHGDAVIVPSRLKTFGGYPEELPMITLILSQGDMTGALITQIV